jgi:propanol-preferring alcohol dehydrogenase
MNNDTIPQSMQAMVFEGPGKPLTVKTVKVPSPSDRQVLIKIIACGVCRTDIHIIDGELDHPKIPLIPGHEIIGRVVKAGKEVTLLKEGEIVGVPWLGYTCGTCKYCLKNQENLCENALFTGYTTDGGFAEYTVANEQFCFPVAAMYANPSGAPLLCAGLIGFRSYKMTGEESEHIGIYGFGAAAQILVQVAVHQGKRIYAFTREGDSKAQTFARSLGAVWAGDSSMVPPVKLDAAILFAPVGSLVPKALRDLDKGGTVVCGGIHMSDIPSFPYDILWGERAIRSVANLTRSDRKEFLQIAPGIPVKTEIHTYRLSHANEAVDDLKKGKISGAAVLVMQ